MNIIITGATGFLGSNILKMLLKQNHKIIVLKRTFSNRDRIENFLNKVIMYNLDEVSLESVLKIHNVELIIHCATDYGRKETSNTSTVVNANLVLPLELIELGKKYKVKVFINTDTILDKRTNMYTLSKKQFYDWMGFYKKNVVCINISLEHFFGPHDDETKFLSYIVNALLTNVAEIPLTLGEQHRDFIYIDDVVSAFDLVIKSLDKLHPGKIHHFEIGSGKTISIKDIVLKLKHLTGNDKTNLLFGKLPYRQNEVMQSVVNLSHIKALGWTAKTPLLDGLQKTILAKKFDMGHA